MEGWPYWTAVRCVWALATLGDGHSDLRLEPSVDQLRHPVLPVPVGPRCPLWSECCCTVRCFYVDENSHLSLYSFYPSISSVATHFTKYRSTAIGIAAAGSGLGS